jgi:drug/metabolite transporter (DMT)-like permease
MTATPAALFAIATAIWGSTWLAIKFQLGVVDPQASVAYRFALAATILAAACALRGRTLRFPPRTHAWLAAQGATFFGLNYIGVYLAERHVASGLVAVVFSTIVFMTPIGTRLAFGTPIAPRTAIGATLGVAGVSLLFLPELRAAGNGGDAALGIGYALGATAIAAVGNLVSMQLHRDRVPLFAGTAWGMAYGALTAALVATLAGTAWTFDPRLPYVASLLYLAVPGSIVAFGAYFLLLRQVGAGPASFVGVSTPVVAMLLSTGFEGYRWTWVAAAGVALAVAGNLIALRRTAAGAPASTSPRARQASSR